MRKAAAAQFDGLVSRYGRYPVVGIYVYTVLCLGLYTHTYSHTQMLLRELLLTF